MHERYTPSARTDDVVIQELGDELLLYDRRTDVAHSLSAVAATVWRKADGQTDFAAIVSAVAEHEDPELAEGLTLRALDELHEKGLLDRAPKAGLSRRQALGRLAGAGMAAVTAPLVVSATVTTPAQAASGNCIAQNGQCTVAPDGNNDNCCGSLFCTRGVNSTGGAPAGTEQQYCKSALGCTANGFQPNNAPCAAANNQTNAQCCSGKCGNGNTAAQALCAA